MWTATMTARSPALRLLCGILLALGFPAPTSSTSYITDEVRREKQRTQFFIPHDVDDILAEGTKALRAKGVSSFNFQTYFCSWSEDLQQHSCRDHSPPPVPIVQGGNEHDLLNLLKMFCAEAMETMSLTGSAYQVLA